MKKTFIIALCTLCGRYHLIDESCQDANRQIFANLPNYKFDDCLICGRRSGGRGFCEEHDATMNYSDKLDIVNSAARAEQLDKYAYIQVVLK